MAVTYGNKISGTFEWTADRIAELRAKWEAWESAAAIAAHFSGLPNGPSRSAVIGKVHRLRLASRPKQVPRPARTAPASRAGRLFPKQSRVERMRKRRAELIAGPQIVPDAEPIDELPPPPEFLGVDLLDLERTQCHFPRGNGPFLFCGQPVERGSYCGNCYRIVYMPPRPARRAPFIQPRWNVA